MKLFTLCFLLASGSFANIDNWTFDSEKTLYIVDGDSISVQMRIAGIDTPEIKQTCQKTKSEFMDCGQLSKDYLAQTLKNLSGKLSIQTLRIDHHNRVLVRVYKGNINIGKLLVESGMAYSYRDTYRKEENLAKAEKRGFWGFYQPPIQPYKWRKLN